MTEQSASGKKQFCPWCKDCTYQVLIRYEPEPNNAQTEAEDIPTDELQLVAGDLCCNCGDLITAIPSEVRRIVDTDTDRDGGESA